MLCLIFSSAQAQTETIVFSTSGAWGTNYNGLVTITPNYTITSSWTLNFSIPTSAVFGNAWLNSSNPPLNVGSVSSTFSGVNITITGRGAVNIPANTPFVVNFSVSNVTNNAAPTNFVFTNANKTGTLVTKLNCTSPSNIIPCNGNVGIGNFASSADVKGELHLKGIFYHGGGSVTDYNIIAYSGYSSPSSYRIIEGNTLKPLLTYSSSQSTSMNNRPSVAIGDNVNPWYRTFEVNGGRAAIYGTSGTSQASQENLLQLVSRRTNAATKVGGTHYLNFSHDLYPSPSNQEYSIINSHEYKDDNGAQSPKDLVLQNNSGNVGIGFYITPLTDRLQVTGNIRLNGNSTNGFIFPNGTKLTSTGFYSSAGVQIPTPGGYWTKNSSNIFFSDGNVGIGTNTPGEKLHIIGNLKIEGKLAVKEVCANPTSSWCDYVFEPDYKLPKIATLQAFLKQNKHLPDVPSAAEVKESGYNMMKLDTALLKKLEEAHLYIIDLEGRVNKLEKSK